MGSRAGPYEMAAFRTSQAQLLPPESLTVSHEEDSFKGLNGGSFSEAASPIQRHQAYQV